MSFNPKQYTVTASAATLTSIIGTKLFIQQVDVKAKTGNTGVTYLGGVGVTNVPANAGVALEAGVAWSKVFTNSNTCVTTDDIYIVGTASDIAFITVID